MNKTTPRSVLFLLTGVSIAIWGYSCYRADILNMTHDESSTWLNFHQSGFWECISKKECWFYANNHLLNTWCLQQSVQLFGLSDWSVRFPNLLAHLLYLAAGIFIISQLTRRLLPSLAGWALLNLNPYMLDFFSLARGYGMGLGFSMLSLAFLTIYLRQPTWKAAVGIFIACALAILSVFTQFNWMAAMGITFGVFCIKIFYPDWKKISLTLAIPTFIILLLFGILWQPIVWLQESGEFKWGTNSLSATFRTLAEDTNYGERYFSDLTVPVLYYTTAILTILAILWGVRFLFSKKNHLSASVLSASSLLFFSMVLIMVLQKWILGTEYFIHRKSLIFIPVWGLLTFSFFITITRSNTRLQHVLSGVIFIVGVWHFSRTMNFKHTREWWYDCHTLEMLEYLDHQIPEGETVQLGVSWFFFPTSMYYQQTNNLDFFTDLKYDKNILPEAGFDYYYVFRSDYEKLLKDQYRIEQEYDFAVLLKRK